MNNVVLIGRLVKDPAMSYLQSGTAVARFTLAIDRDYKNKDGTVTTDFIPVEIMGKPAEFCSNYITKGRLVGIQGSIRVDRYETQTGESKTFTKVFANNIKALDFKKQENNNNNETAQYSAINDDDVPF